jgi:hypothetical protein
VWDKERNKEEISRDINEGGRNKEEATERERDRDRE